MDLSFILPTISICEWFIPTAGYFLHDRKKRLSPLNFEMQCFGISMTPFEESQR